MDGEALIDAVKANDIQTVRALVQSGVDVNAVDYLGRMALHCAVYDGFVECMQVVCIVVEM